MSLKFETYNKKMALAVFKSLNPDNVNIPKELSFNFRLDDNCILLQVTTKNDLETLISTVKEVLDNIGLCVQIIMASDDDKN